MRTETVMMGKTFFVCLKDEDGKLIKGFTTLSIDGLLKHIKSINILLLQNKLLKS